MKQTTIRYNGHELDVSALVDNVYHWEFNDDKTRLYVFGEDVVYEYALSTTGEICTAAYTSNSRALDELEHTDSVQFFGDGRYMKVGDKMYAMSGAWDVTTAVSIETKECPMCGKEVPYEGTGDGATWTHPDGPCPAWDGNEDGLEDELRGLVEEWREKGDGAYHEWSRIYNSCADELEEVLE